MTATKYLETAQGRRLAYRKSEGKGPTIVFMSGLMSDMEGTKAVHLEAWAQARGQAYVRFDYSGHGESSGKFTDGCIGDWHEDTLAVVSELTEGPLIAVGSSMGGWQALLLARAIPERIVGMVTIAAAPDFTQNGYWDKLDDAQKEELEREGQLVFPSEYSDPYTITKRLIDEGRQRLVLHEPLNLPFPTRFLQGTADTAVSTELAIQLLEHAKGDDMRLLLVKDADHRFSDGPCLGLIEDAVLDVMGER